MVKKLNNFIKYIFLEQPTLARLTLNTAFNNILSDLRPGKILDIGAGEYNSHIDDLKGDCDYISLNLLLSEKPAVVADACMMPLSDNSIDNILILEVLEHVLTTDILIKECLRVLKNDGIMIGSTRFIHPEHGAPHDYYRFTEESLKTFLGLFSECKIEKLGNKVHVLIDIISENYLFLRIFNRILQYIRLRPSTCHSGFLFVAKK
jgi:SAM-dependent methyltransferase